MYRIFRVPQIGFLGAGNLAEALTKGFIAAGTLQIHQVWASAPTEKEIYWVKQLGCKTTTDNKKLVEGNNIIVLAVKPQQLPKVLREISPSVHKDHLILSFAAGKFCEILKKCFKTVKPDILSGKTFVKHLSVREFFLKFSYKYSYSIMWPRIWEK